MLQLPYLPSARCIQCLSSHAAKEQLDQEQPTNLLMEHAIHHCSARTLQNACCLHQVINSFCKRILNDDLILLCLSVQSSETKGRFWGEESGILPQERRWCPDTKIRRQESKHAWAGCRRSWQSLLAPSKCQKWRWSWWPQSCLEQECLPTWLRNTCQMDLCLQIAVYLPGGICRLRYISAETPPLNWTLLIWSGNFSIALLRTGMPVPFTIKWLLGEASWLGFEAPNLMNLICWCLLCPWLWIACPTTKVRLPITPPAK